MTSPNKGTMQYLEDNEHLHLSAVAMVGGVTRAGRIYQGKFWFICPDGFVSADIAMAKNLAMSVFKGSTINCNKCDEKFALDAHHEVTRARFHGTVAARLNGFLHCPHCNQTDTHWVYANTIIPEFEGSFGKKKQSRKQWLKDN